MDVDREDVLLLLLDANERASGKPQFKGVTRLEKLIFLLSKEESGQFLEPLFEFKAYKFGPFSAGVYEATEFLSGLKLVDVEERGFPNAYSRMEEAALHESISDEVEVDGSTMSTAAREKLFQLTETGRSVAAKLRSIWTQERPDVLEKIDAVVRRYGALPLSQLIRYVYRRYPDMAARSIHPEANNLQGA